MNTKATATEQQIDATCQACPLYLEMIGGVRMCELLPDSEEYERRRERRAWPTGEIDGHRCEQPLTRSNP